MFERSGVTLGELQRLGRKVVRKGGKQVLLIASDERLFAVANRCPHEGYPLSEGTLGPPCVLTCDWHNWKFDLASGETLVGRDPVRAYPVRVEDGEIAVDLANPPADLQRERALRGLLAAIADDDRTRMAREVARLERAGFDARLALVHAIEAVSERLEGGMTHAHAAAADWLALSERAPTADLRLTALLEPVGHLARDTLGAGRYPYAQGQLPWDAEAFLAAMEAEDEFTSQAHVRGALDDGLTYPELRPTLGRAALAHYADFGHSTIYVLKAGQLIERLGDAVTLPVLQALIRQLIYARREDRLPEFRGYPGALEAWSDRRARPATSADFIGLSVAAILRRLVASAGRPPTELFDALMGAAGWNLLHFDAEFDHAAGRVIADSVSWLAFTHALTFANAAHHLCTDDAELWPAALLQLALFVGRNKPFVNAQQDLAEWAVDEPAAFLEREMAALYDHAIPEPIIACHRIKVLFALEDELAREPGAPWAGVTCAAVNRYLNTPMKRHHGLRLARQARAFVAKEG
ncbi:MAG TPA: Rieske 2Fe-2S domain-containing protein [Caulobacteraceae bacterium]|nr:Rieske 2Fe-2S domain-containing protein [Caulobacteraceae bacterium]